MKKLLLTPLKLLAIFNSTTKVSKSFNLDTFIFFFQIALTGITVKGILGPKFLKVHELKDFKTLGDLLKKLKLWWLN